MQKFGAVCFGHKLPNPKDVVQYKWLGHCRYHLLGHGLLGKNPNDGGPKDSAAVDRLLGHYFGVKTYKTVTQKMVGLVFYRPLDIFFWIKA